MPALQTAKNRIYPIDMSRDECPVIFSNPGDTDKLKKQFAKLKKFLKVIPMQADPAIELKKTRQQRGLV